MQRLHNLDYLRGLAALGIMCYHLISWSFGHGDASSPIARLGIYGVTIFYVLSGLTLYHVYSATMGPTWRDIGSFAKKRLFRIYPLLWLALILSILLIYLKGSGEVSFYQIVINFTGTFGFFDWDNTLTAGEWSIGNELVFYVMFPLFMLVAKRFSSFIALLIALHLGIYLYFTFWLIDPSVSLPDQWGTFINPLNQSFYFLAGFLIGYFFKERKYSDKVAVGLILLGLILFLFTPATGMRVNLIIGVPRLLLTLSCILICLGAYKFTAKVPHLIHKPLVFLGEISYSLYLLHPLVFQALTLVYVALLAQGIALPATSVAALTFFMAIFVSYLSYRFVEKPFIRMARSRTKSI